MTPSGDAFRQERRQDLLALLLMAVGLIGVVVSGAETSTVILFGGALFLAFAAFLVRVFRQASATPSGWGYFVVAAYLIGWGCLYVAVGGAGVVRDHGIMESGGQIILGMVLVVIGAIAARHAHRLRRRPPEPPRRVT